MQSTESTCSELCTDLARKDALYRAPEGIFYYILNKIAYLIFPISLFQLNTVFVRSGFRI